MDPRVDAFAMSIGAAAVFGSAGNMECGAKMSAFIVDAGTLGVGSGSSFAFRGQVYTVMVDGGGLRVVVYAAAVEVVVCGLIMVGESEVVFGATFGASGVSGTLEGVGCDWEVVATAGAFGI